MGSQTKKPRPPRGTVPGIPNKRTAKSVAANRVRAYQHGKRAQVVTAQDVRHAKLEKIQKGAPDVIRAFAQAIQEGNIDAVHPLAITAMSETEILRRDAVDKIHSEGIMVEDEVLDSEGKIIGIRKRANPLLEHIHKFNAGLGFTAQDLLISRKSRGEGARDAAAAVLMAREAKLVGADRSRIPPPAED